MELQPTDILKCFRAINKTKNNLDTTNPPKIIVQFATNELKNEFKKRPAEGLNVENLKQVQLPANIDRNRPIYIQESLNKEQSHIAYLTRQFKKRHNYGYAWTRDGISYLRFYDNQPVHEINNEADLEKLEVQAKQHKEEMDKRLHEQAKQSQAEREEREEKEKEEDDHEDKKQKQDNGEKIEWCYIANRMVKKSLANKTGDSVYSSSNISSSSNNPNGGNVYSSSGSGNDSSSSSSSMNRE